MPIQLDSIYDSFYGKGQGRTPHGPDSMKPQLPPLHKTTESRQIAYYRDPDLDYWFNLDNNLALPNIRKVSEKSPAKDAKRPGRGQHYHRRDPSLDDLLAVDDLLGVDDDISYYQATSKSSERSSLRKNYPLPKVKKEVSE